MEDNIPQAILIPNELDAYVLNIKCVLKTNELIHLDLHSSASEVKAAVIQTIHWQMEADRKIGALKSFQGYMWKEGFESGVLRGE